MAEECSHECGSCGVSGCGERTAAGPTKLETNKRSNVKHVIGVVSGKGGVGKSLVTSLLASEMNKRGNKVGILDADITGPSIPKTFGITNPLTADADGILPGQTQTGIKVMSTNLMLPKGDLPVAWRGPVVSNAIRQFWSETNWGDIDYLFVDMPPGTSDVLLDRVPVAARRRHRHRVGTAGAGGHDRGQGREPGARHGRATWWAWWRTWPTSCATTAARKHHIFGEPQGQAVAEKYAIPASATVAHRSGLRPPVRCRQGGGIRGRRRAGQLMIIDKIVEAAESRMRKQPNNGNSTPQQAF